MLKVVTEELWTRWQALKFGACLIVAIALFAVPFWFAIHRLKVWRINNYPHASALVMRTWTKTVHGEKGNIYYVPMGHLQFVRTNGEETFDCAINLKIPEHYSAGETIDIVPREDSCFEPIVPEFALN